MERGPLMPTDPSIFRKRIRRAQIRPQAGGKWHRSRDRISQFNLGPRHYFASGWICASNLVHRYRVGPSFVRMVSSARSL